MKKIGFIVFAAALAIGLVVSSVFSFGQTGFRPIGITFGFSKVHGSGNVVAEHRDVKGFHGIDVGSVYEVNITAGKEFDVLVETDDNIVPLIRTEVSRGILSIKADKRFSSTNGVKITISMPDIDKIETSGAASVSVAGVRNDNLSVDSSGASEVKISGETANAVLEASGGANIDAAELKAVNVKVDSSGGSDLKINASGILSVHASGGSDISYTGTPEKIEKHTSGGASVSQM